MLLWQAKASKSAQYTTMKTPSTYQIDFEDLDDKSYRSINTGNINRTIVSKQWSKFQLSYKHLTPNEVKSLLSTLNNYPLYIKILTPINGDNYMEYECYCSKKTVSMLENHNYTMSFNLVQGKKVSGQ
jgi:hypothetical protein